METENVTPIKPLTRRQLRRLAPRKGLLLRDSDDDDGFSTLDLVNGLRGVCYAADQIVVSNNDIDIAQDLAMAAKILSSILASRVEA